MFKHEKQMLHEIKVDSPNPGGRPFDPSKSTQPPSYNMPQ